jgi:hypothetical protein
VNHVRYVWSWTIRGLRTEGVNQRRKRLLQNTPKACAGWLAERPSGLGGLGRGGLGRPAGQGRGSGQAGWAEWAEFRGIILFE